MVRLQEEGDRMEAVHEALSGVMADTYALYLKCQYYHWHVSGSHAFKALHELFEMFYKELAEVVDEMAERIVMLGGHAPGTFTDLNAHKKIQDVRVNLSVNEMIEDLSEDQTVILASLHDVLAVAIKHHDEATADLLIGRIAAHEKMAWMLSSSQDNL
jgi:starvation-inducible DNA-binding protein